MNHADRLALFTLNKLSEIFSTWTKAWERLSNTHSDQIIAQHVIFAYFIKVSRLHLCVTIWTCCLQRYLGSLQEKAIKIHVANGAGVDFPSLILPSEAVWGCRNCWAADTAVALSVLCLSALHQAPSGFVSLGCTGTPDGLWDHVIMRSTGVQDSTVCCSGQSTHVPKSHEQH